MGKLYIYIAFIMLNIKINSKDPDDIFEVHKNLRFCGADHLSQNLKLPPKNDIKINNIRSLTTKEYKPIRIFVETTFLEYQGNNNINLIEQVPIIKNALNKAVEGIKGLINVEDNSPYEEIKLKPRKLKTKLFFGRSKLDIVNENVINENIESEIKENQEDKKEEIKTDAQPNIENKELISNKEIVEEVIGENYKEDILKEEKEQKGNKEEKDGNLQEKQEIINKEIEKKEI